MTESSSQLSESNVLAPNFQKNVDRLKRFDRYAVYEFTERENPEAALMARQIHAMGYRDMGFVNDRAFMEDGTLAGDIDKARGDDVDYFLETNPENSDDYATMRIKSGDVQSLPAFALTKDNLTEEGMSELLEADIVKEVGALARTPGSSPMMVMEMLRHNIQKAHGKNELWFFSIVSTTFRSLQGQYGDRALRQIGDPVEFDDDRISKGITLVPALFDVDTFLDSVATSALETQDLKQRRILFRTLMYYSEGLDEKYLTQQVQDLRTLISSSMQPKGA